ncbi:MAG: NTP transferase domain-containing protein [Myxococcales bacterium]|nr:NTP transferase domain-containing protein [Myxococcales bacterium]
MQVVILAGGLATRMRPLTDKIPKALIPVLSRPFIDWQLAALASSGYDDVILCIAHLGDQIRAHVGDGGRIGIRVRYSEEGPRLMGTGGAARAAFPHLAPTFLVTYGDSYLPFDYGSPLRVLNANEDCDGVMSVFRNAGKWDASNVALRGDFVSRYEKGHCDPELDCIDYGAIALRRGVLERRPANVAFGLDEVLGDMARRSRLRAVIAEERFYEIGSPEGLSTLEQKLKGPS